MAEFFFDIEPQGPVLDAYYYDRSPVSLIMGPIGSGKTTQTCLKILTMMTEQEPNAEGIRPTRWLVIRNTYADLFGTTIKDWLEVARGLGPFKQGGREPPSQKIRFELDDNTIVESEIIFIALDRDEHVRKLRGYQITGAWLSEAKELNKAIVDMAEGRCGRYPSMAAGGVMPTWHGMVGDTNAPDEENWYYKLAEEERPEGWSFHRQPGGVIKVRMDGTKAVYEVNPDAENARNLPEGYYQRLIEGKTDDWISVNLANEYGFVVNGKAVYPEYRDSYHCRPVSFDPRLPVHIGMDFGLTPAVTFKQRSPMGQVRVLSELVATRLGAKNLAREIKLHLADKYPDAQIGTITGDPAGEAGSSIDENQTVFTVLAAEGVIAKPAHTNDFTIRRESVAEMLTQTIDGEPALLIDPSCRKLRKGMAGGYFFRKVKVAGERYEQKPDKGQYSHVCEALQYGCMGLGIGKEVIIQPHITQQMKANRPRVAQMDYNEFG